MRRFIASAALVALLSTPALAQQTLEGVAADTYQLDPTHAFLTWTVQHNGLSGYTVNFTDFDATLDFDPEDPGASELSVTIDPMGVETNHPDADEREEWHTEISTDDRFLNGDEYSEITFVSTSAEQTGDFTGTVTGDLTFLGVTKPVTLDVTYNGTANVPWYGPRDLIGFNATTTIKRSDFGMTAMIPMISDEVEIEFSGEFLQNE
ncbi:MAG: YceI family protein [Henriciella sp.]|uniref:YceI family protein n=1 Tax=Henriciella sp. TaxID=1968823 RepID=UPI003C7203AC